MLRTPPGILLVALIALQSVGAASEGWLVDMEAAKEQAAAEGKSLLIDFTGSDWCIWCKKLDGEVFQEERFRKEAPDRFVLVTLDYPADKSGQSEETKAQNARLAETYAVSGFPTVIVADASGRPYAVTGYQPGGAPAYLDHLNDLVKVKQRFDAALVRADQADGAVRARRLDEALAMLPGNYLSPFYVDVMRQIIEADPTDETGLGEKYRELLDSASRDKALLRIAACVEARTEASDWQGLIADMEAVLGDHGRIPVVAQRALLTKGRALLELGDLEGGLAALVAARDALAEGDTVAVLDRMIKDVREELGS